MKNSENISVIILFKKKNKYIERSPKNTFDAKDHRKVFREILEDPNKWRDRPCSLTGQLNTVKISSF